MVRHDWISLKNQFVTSNWLTISDFFRDKGIKDNSRNRLHTKGWLLERKEYQHDLFLKTKEQIAENEVDIRIRQLEIVREMQTKGSEELQNLPVRNVEDARKLIVAGLEQERAILDVKEKEGIPSSLTQVNVSYPKTRLDEFLDSQDFEGLLELIVEVKKEKKRINEKQVENQ